MSTARRVSLAPLTESAVNNRRNSLTSRQSIGFSKGRDSIESVNRKSSVGVSRKSISDPRSMQDPDFKNSAMKTLLQYLTSHEYNHTITPKSIQKPSVKDFANIVIFLFMQVDKHMSLKGKFEDDVVNVFKQLKYQHSISKQNLAAPGTPHTWPTLLATLHWLVDLLLYCENSTIEISTLQEYLFQSYEYFNRCDDDQCAQLYDDFIMKIRSENDDINREIGDIEREVKDLDIEHQQIERGLSRYPELQKKLSDYKSDYGKFMQIITELSNHQEQLEVKKRMRENEIHELDDAILSVSREIEQLEGKVATQSISAKEAEVMRTQQFQLQKEQDATAIKFKEIQEKVYIAEDSLRTNVAQLERAQEEYNNVVDSLYNVPSSVKKQLNISVDTRTKKKSAILLTDIHNHTLPSYHTLRNDLEHKLNILTTQQLDLDDHLEKLLVKSDELKSQETSLLSKLSVGEENYNKDKLVFEQIAAERAADIRMMESQLLDAKDLSSEELSISASNRKLAEARAVHESEALRHSLMKKELISEILNAVTDCANFRDYVQNQLKDLKGINDERLELLQNKLKSFQEE